MIPGTRHGKTRQDNTRHETQDKPRQGWQDNLVFHDNWDTTRQAESRQDKIRKNKTWKD